MHVPFSSMPRSALRWALRPMAVLALTALAACSPPAPTSQPAAQPQDCDRACLDQFAKQFLESLVAHDPSLLPLSPNVRYTEDSKDLRPGEGLWSRASALRQHRLNVLDDEWDTAAGLAVMEADGELALLGYRLKVENREVTEIETMVVDRSLAREVINRENLAIPRAEFLVEIPPGQRESRAELIRISEFYPEGLRVGSFEKVDAPFAEGARRLENGSVLAGPDCTFNANCKDMKAQPSPERPTLRHRLLAVDEEQGITFYWLAWEQQSGRTLIVWEGFKVYGGKIHGVDAFLEYGDPTIDSGW